MQYLWSCLYYNNQTADMRQWWALFFYKTKGLDSEVTEMKSTFVTILSPDELQLTFYRFAAL